MVDQTVSSAIGSGNPKIAACQDDIIITGSDDKLISTFIDRLNNKFSLKDLGSLSYFLGIEVLRRHSGILLSQAKYVKDILARATMTDAKPSSTPADVSTKLVREGTPFASPQLYRRIVGALQYVTISRPDITYAVNRVCQYMHAPSEDHWVAVKRILRFLKGTIDSGLHLQPSSLCSLRAYSDAGWVSDSDDCRSQYGFAVYLGSNLISWTSRKQKVVARSSTEAEFRALAYTTAEVIWLQQLLTELGLPLSSPPQLLCDNVGAVFMSANPVIGSRSKHIHLDYFFVREQVDAGLLRVQHVSAKDQVADIFTKPLPRLDFHRLMSKLQVRSRS